MYFRDYAQELYFQPHFIKMVQDAPKLTALTLHPRTFSTIELLTSSTLKHLTLHISIQEIQPGPMTFPDVTACPMLESLKVVTKSPDASPNEFYFGHQADKRHQPGICLSHMHQLRYFQLEEQALLRDKLALPLGCQLFLRLRKYREAFSWGGCWGSVLCHATVLCLELEDVRQCPAWLSDSRLQLLVLEITNTFTQPEPLDMALFKHIPHVRLLSKGARALKLTHTEGSWQSLEVIAQGGVSVEFSNIEAFVICTELFSFCYSYRSRTLCTTGDAAVLMDKLQVMCAACGVECHRTSHRNSDLATPTWVARISKRKLKAPFDREDALQNADSECAIWQLTKTQLLAPYEDFWPQDPCKPLDGMDY